MPHIELRIRVDKRDDDDQPELVKLFTGDDHHDEQTC